VYDISLSQLFYIGRDRNAHFLDNFKLAFLQGNQKNKQKRATDFLQNGLMDDHS